MKTTAKTAYEVFHTHTETHETVKSSYKHVAVHPPQTQR